jgi:hypothetical protein
MPSSVFERVESLLKQHGIAFQVVRHEPVYTSEEAVRVLGYAQVERPQLGSFAEAAGQEGRP